MCGIGGAVALVGSLKNHQKYLAVFDKFLTHRGPDGSNHWVNSDSSVLFAHYRLAVIGLSADSAQPMASLEQNIVSFNGEIYNYRELRENAAQRGYRFHTKSDTESILATYALDGVVGISKLRGMFAFALWNRAAQTLTRAVAGRPRRDQPGQRWRAHDAPSPAPD